MGKGCTDDGSKEREKGIWNYLISEWLKKAVILGSIGYPFIAVIDSIFFSNEWNFHTFKEFLYKSLITLSLSIVVFSIIGTVLLDYKEQDLQ